ncbi:hypothetical protein PVT67_01965 [Gallaecimonas kandeliae]|uniref:hypothetical protein n=1 Tax=Gallaecimonas kandeliae TaxID=3029055 RepID=UPI00264712C2|nr:hypothetical protein [Gallaecimonas kandeliae]WKE66039.1 hypothetical protein PVT67_01965 [Gallaecimonas kandeliae]
MNIDSMRRLVKFKYFKPGLLLLALLISIFVQDRYLFWSTDDIQGWLAVIGLVMTGYGAIAAANEYKRRHLYNKRVELVELAWRLHFGLEKIIEDIDNIGHFRDGISKEDVKGELVELTERLYELMAVISIVKPYDEALRDYGVGCGYGIINARRKLRKINFDDFNKSAQDSLSNLESKDSLIEANEFIRKIRNRMRKF